MLVLPVGRRYVLRGGGGYCGVFKLKQKGGHTKPRTHSYTHIKMKMKAPERVQAQGLCYNISTHRGYCVSGGQIERPFQGGVSLMYCFDSSSPPPSSAPISRL